METLPEIEILDESAMDWIVDEPKSREEVGNILKKYGISANEYYQYSSDNWNIDLRKKLSDNIIESVEKELPGYSIKNGRSLLEKVFSAFIAANMVAGAPQFSGNDIVLGRPVSAYPIPDFHPQVKQVQFPPVKCICTTMPGAVYTSFHNCQDLGIDCYYKK